jgi:hypothetical protein
MGLGLSATDSQLEFAVFGIDGVIAGVVRPYRRLCCFNGSEKLLVRLLFVSHVHLKDRVLIAGTGKNSGAGD